MNCLTSVTNYSMLPSYKGWRREVTDRQDPNLQPLTLVTLHVLLHHRTPLRMGWIFPAARANGQTVRVLCERVGVSHSSVRCLSWLYTSQCLVCAVVNVVIDCTSNEQSAGDGIMATPHIGTVEAYFTFTIPTSDGLSGRVLPTFHLDFLVSCQPKSEFINSEKYFYKVSREKKLLAMPYWIF